jgi:TonB family protein
MNARFMFHLKIVAAVHVIAAVLLLTASSLRGCRKKREPVVMPLEFVVKVEPPAEQDTIAAPIKEPEVKQEEAPQPVPVKKKRERKPIERSTRKVVRSKARQPPRKTLSPEEIRKRLAAGAKPGDYDSPLPSDEARCFQIVHETLHRAWAQPSKEEVGDAVVSVIIRIDQNGRLTDRKLVRPSGNSVLDTSVLQAVRSVRRIDGLSKAFLSRHEEITAAFKVE